MKHKQVREVAYLGKKVYFGNKPYTLVENEVKGMCQGCDLYNCYCPSRITSLCTQGFILNTLVLKYKTCLNNEATIIGIDSNILKNFGDKQVYISYERGEEK